MIRPAIPALMLALAAVPSTLHAQAVVQPLPGTTTADRLADQMRVLATNPTDLNALLTAGELSIRLDDLGAAASFFARAEKVDPHNGRAKAGQAAILVHAERPGEALRYFATAESYGLAPATFASDRGLAYDLIGEQERAQRDYRLALRTAPDDETLRRYALSLGISGKRDLAEQQLQPLLKKQDRGAWRARAFIEAMTGNGAEASHIATTMLPPGTATGLQPFFARLPTLGPVDRAFAVHFGEVRGTPQRLADARLAPPLAALGPDPYAPRSVQVAAAAPAVVEKGRRKEKKGKQPVAVATVAPTTVPPQVVTPPPPARTTVAAVVPTVTRAPVPVTPRPASPAVTLAASGAPRAMSPTTSTALPPPPAEHDVRVAAAGTSGVARVVTMPTATPAIAPVTVVAAPSHPTAAAVTPSAPSPTSVPPAAPTTVASVARPPSVVAAPARTPTVMTPAPARIAPRRDELASIVGGISIPASELGIAGPRRPEPAPVVALPPSAEDRAAADRAAAAEKAAADRAAAAKALTDKKAADRKAAADKKALAEKKAAAEKKAEEVREAAAQKKLERANPERIWVQVAGGAYEGDLPKAWAAAKKKGGDVFAGHATGYTTPLRFTNRVLAGPFKTDEEARAFVNKLKAKGMSGFTFTSDAGQVVKKLGTDE